MKEHSRASALTGLIAATHTPMNSDGSLNLAAVENQAAHLINNRITAAFICGSTGEAHSLSQLKSLAFVRICAPFGYMRAAKAAMAFVGVDCGPVRSPLRPLDDSERTTLFAALESSGLF
jgi:dihydrodipicolinate synthase/N-acetylneuraminate lyase